MGMDVGQISGGYRSRDWWVVWCEGSTWGVSEKDINTEFCDIEIIFSFLQMHSNGGTNTLFLNRDG